MQNICDQYYQAIINLESSITQKYKAIFELRTINNEEAIEFLHQAFKQLQQDKNKSCLLLHEIAYAMGQINQEYSKKYIDFLISVIQDDTEFDVVRHEAAEALANISQDKALAIFEQYKHKNNNDPENILRDTCELGYNKIITYAELKQFYGLQYCGTLEPAAPFQEIENPIQFILDEKTPLFDKYRALYYVRNNAAQYLDDLALLLTSNLGALIKHEICFVIGQVGVGSEKLTQTLFNVAKDETCPSIFRHEAIAAFQTLSGNKGKEFLESFKDCPDQIVRETAEVSISMMEFYGKI